MKTPLKTFLTKAFLSLFLLMLNQCGSSSSDHGPFDKNGNYVEAWADKKGGSKKISSSERKKIEEEAREAERRFREIERENKKKKTVKSKEYKYQPKKKVVASTNTKPKATSSNYTKKSATYKAPVKAKAKPKPVAIKASPKFRWHFVRKGETLWAISQRYGKSVSSIQSLNGMRGNAIWAGKRIKVPK